MDILEKLNHLEKLITEQNISQKEVLNFNEATQYLGISDSHLYKLTSGNKIPFYKPGGKIIYFQREELNNWLLSNRIASDSEIIERASAFKLKKGGVS
ncbi:helix-turn-helix domain-containing protein [uncultured Arcticibacterium sp.]|jgi:excisionase family DNA binding protein|uniref:helix-turn-helix domain-containing protein n=1 Tax=uncultured Arcticibacterium sp. TaxID=2173042 RepID=UPI0030FCA94F